MFNQACGKSRTSILPSSMRLPEAIAPQHALSTHNSNMSPSALTRWGEVLCTGSESARSNSVKKSSHLREKGKHAVVTFTEDSGAESANTERRAMLSRRKPTCIRDRVLFTQQSKNRSRDIVLPR